METPALDFDTDIMQSPELFSKYVNKYCGYLTTARIVRKRIASVKESNLASSDGEDPANWGQGGLSRRFLRLKLSSILFQLITSTRVSWQSDECRTRWIP